MTCAGCGQTFTPKRKHGRFCSSRCRLDAWAVRKATAARQDAAVDALTHLGATWTPDPRFYRPERPAWLLLGVAEAAAAKGAR